MAICPSKAAYKKELSFLKKTLKKMGATDIKFSSGYYYFSGFATIAGKILYFSCNDARSWEFEKKLLIRTAESYKDFSGGMNNYSEFDENQIESLSNQLISIG